MDDKEIRIIKAIYEKTKEVGSSLNPFLFQAGSGLTIDEFKDFLRKLEGYGYIQHFQDQDIILSQSGLEWIEWELNGENQRRSVRFLKALYDQTLKKELKFYSYRDFVEVGTQLGLKENEVKQLCKFFQKKGYIYVTTNREFRVSQTGKTLLEGLKNQLQYNIFISHIHEDEKIAIKLKDFLRECFGDKIEVFISDDPKNIPAGQDFFTTIIDNIKKCDCMIVFCSPPAIKRYYIYFEVGGAAILERKIISLCFNGQNPGALPAPLDHLRKQAIDCANKEKLEEHFKILLQTIASKINVPVPTNCIIRSEFYQMISKLSIPSSEGESGDPNKLRIDRLIKYYNRVNTDWNVYRPYVPYNKGTLDRLEHAYEDLWDISNSLNDDETKKIKPKLHNALQILRYIIDSGHNGASFFSGFQSESKRKKEHDEFFSLLKDCITELKKPNMSDQVKAS
jgi:MTH538 TIR-like domain (DUF1863).